jgi:DNA-binding response OmpR family regulator
MSTNDRQTILAIDNDDDLLRALAKRLGSLGFRCITAASGAQGLVQFRGDKVDLIVSDLNMPDGDGLALAETVRRTSDVPIIFVTGFRDEFKRRLRVIRNVTTLRKPFNSQTLIDLISLALAENAASGMLVDTMSEDL